MLFARQMPQVFIQSHLMYPDCLIDLFKSASIAQHTLRPHRETTPTAISSSSGVSDSTSVVSRIADAMGQLVLGNIISIYSHHVYMCACTNTVLL
jgi:hypothetical protein